MFLYKFCVVQILSNGTTHMAPCVALRTPLKTYLFNAPEGTSRYNIIRVCFILFNKVNSVEIFLRFLPALRLKPTNINDIFVTRGMRL